MMMAGDDKGGMGSDGPTTPTPQIQPLGENTRIAPYGFIGQTNSRKSRIMKRPSGWGLNLCGL